MSPDYRKALEVRDLEEATETQQMKAAAIEETPA